MSGNSDKELDGKLGAWLALWPIEQPGAEASDQAVNLIQSRIESLPIGRGQDNWFDDPFPAEPGERKPGEMTMSDDKELEKPKRSSFKDIAQRVSSVPVMPVSDRNPSKPPPAETSGLKRTLSRPPEARDSDSGIVDLNAVREKAASMPEVAAVPGTSSIFEDEKDGVKSEKASVAPKTAAKPPEKKSSAIPLIGGLSVAALAVAAAFVLVNRGGMRADQAPPSPAAVNAPAASAAPVAQQNPAETPAALAASVALADNKADSVEATRAKVAGPLPAKPAADDSPEKGGAAKPAATTASPGAPAGAPPTDLGSAMAGAVGTGADKAPAAADKAAAGPAAGTIPESPSQGAIQGALGAVMGGARACVAGMDEASKANVTFSNDGKVTGVSVSGPAASKPAGGCIKAALSKARVGPFTRPSYSVGVTVRP